MLDHHVFMLVLSRQIICWLPVPASWICCDISKFVRCIYPLACPNMHFFLINDFLMKLVSVLMRQRLLKKNKHRISEPRSNSIKRSWKMNHPTNISAASRGTKTKCRLCWASDKWWDISCNTSRFYSRYCFHLLYMSLPFAAVICFAQNWMHTVATSALRGSHYSIQLDDIGSHVVSCIQMGRLSCNLSWNGFHSLAEAHGIIAGLNNSHSPRG